MTRCKANPCCSDPYNCEVPLPQHRSGLWHLNEQANIKNIPVVTTTEYVAEQVRLHGIKVRIPEAHEHPLTLDVRIGDADRETVERCLETWRRYSAEVGTEIRPWDEEQQRLIKEFWNSFDPTCLYPSTEFETITEPLAKISFSCKSDSQLEEIKQLESSKVIDDQTDSRYR